MKDQSEKNEFFDVVNTENIMTNHQDKKKYVYSYKKRNTKPYFLNFINL